MVVVVGGQSRKVGKTSVVAGLIRALPDAGWIAIKVTPHHELSGWSLLQESAGAGDSGRYLSAGARQAWYLRCAPETLPEALPSLHALLRHAGNAIIESNSIVDHIRPDLYLAVVDHRTPDRKPSFERNMERADAIILVDADDNVPDKLCFHVSRTDFECAALNEFVAGRLAYCAGKTKPRENTDSVA